MSFFDSELSVVNIGLDLFADTLERVGAAHVRTEWRPPADGDQPTIEALKRFAAWPVAKKDRVTQANAQALSWLRAPEVLAQRVQPAQQVIEGMHPRLILHAGPPVDWAHMCGPMRGGVIGGLLYEGLASSPEQAEALAASGEIAFAPCHHHNAVGPMAGIVTASMPVWVVENNASGDRAYCTLNEGLGKVLRYGAYDREVLTRLAWIRDVLAPALDAALQSAGPLNIGTLIAQALQMGDEGHNRNRAGTSLVIRQLAPVLAASDLPRAQVAEVLRFLDSNDHFFLNLTMPAAKASVMPIAEIPFCSVVSTMARNGTEFGIRLSGLGERWFTGPASVVDGLYLPGFEAKDAARDIGDSVITETAGIGGFAMAAAPAIVKFVGGRAEMASELTQRMYQITVGESDAYRIPALDFRGTPTAIDVRRVVEQSILPAINTGIAHRDPGIGMVGAGLVSPPASCFRQALCAFVATYQDA